MALGLAIYAPAVSAHQGEEDNGTSAVLHIEPQDVAYAGRPTKLALYFGRDNSSFSLNNCTCRYSLSQSGRLITTGAIRPVQGVPSDAIVTVNFPRPGVYNFDISGQATDHSFPNFKLNYQIHVNYAKSQPAASKSHTGRTIIAVIAAALVILAIVAAWQIWRRRSGRSSSD